MEKRIRIVWALSLISMLLLVAGQGYWLWNQYQYKNEEYEEEIHRLVMDAVAVNDSIRREQPKCSTSLIYPFSTPMWTCIRIGIH